ncbi:uncharacterized protein LOC117323676 [Pecten maximus]|uniref:uncharacterized protein LOC117323676 n=1 Tax=Pecten maximus TaxID=6579 RepID=UPI001458F48A|nr:uncharacterized protein LOC117323676 [Pecten maximus]
MPRLTNFVLAKHKRAFGYKPDPRRYKVWNAPFIVNNRLKMASDRLASERPCTDALKIMLDCYKMHDFSYKGLCDTQIQAFEKCMTDHKKKLAESGDTFKSRPNTRTINKLLKNVPQPPITLKLKH